MEERVTSAPFFKVFKKYVGVDLFDFDMKSEEECPPPAKKTRLDQVPDSLGLGGSRYKPKSISKATTTILVRRVFERFFHAAISNRVSGGQTPMSGSCGVCHGCQWKDCGSCRHCLQKRKFGGTSNDNDFTCLDKICTKNGRLLGKAAQILAGQRSLNKMREQQNRKKVKWLDPCPDSLMESVERNYLAVKINGERISNGDFVYVTPDDSSTARYVFRIVRLFQDNSVPATSGFENRLAHVQKFCFGNDTVLGETAEDRELFLLLDCETIQLLEVEGRVDVAYWAGPSNFHQIGNTKESVITPSDEIKERFWFRLRYDPTLSRFEAIEREMLDRMKCYPCEARKQRSARLTPTLQKNGDELILKFRGEDYKVGDGIYLMPGTLDGLSKYKKIKDSGFFVLDRSKDPKVYTEYYRKFLKTSESIKGSTANFPEPFEVAIVTNVRPSKADGKPRVKVRKMYRPENIRNVEVLREGVGETEFQAINYLYWTANEEYILDFNSVWGKCEVRHCLEIATTPFLWSQDDPHRFFYDCVYDPENHSISQMELIDQIKKCEDLDGKDIQGESVKSDTKKVKAELVTQKKEIKGGKGTSDPSSSPLRMMDVQAGVGDLSVGLEQAGVAESRRAVEHMLEVARASKKDHGGCEVMLDDRNTTLSHALEGHTHVKRSNVPMKGEVEEVKTELATSKKETNAGNDPSDPSSSPLRMMDVQAGVGDLSVGLDQAGVAETRRGIERVPEMERASKKSHGGCEVMLDDCNTALSQTTKGHTPVKRWNVPTKGEVEEAKTEPVTPKKETNGGKDTYDHCLRPLRMMDVYAGVGGLSVGLEQAGVAKTRWAIEYVPEAARAFKKNHRDCEVMLDDCNTILRHALKGHTHVKRWKIPTKGEVELLVGGPPCQGFSIMNKFNEREYSTFKNSQISTFLSFCDYYRPKFFILENVKNLGSFKKSMVLKLCMRVLVQMGYQCTFGVLQAGHYGVPQTRRRIFIIAAAPGEVLPDYPEPTHVFEGTDQTVRVDKKGFSLSVCWSSSAPFRCITVRDALSDLLPIQHVENPDPSVMKRYQSCSMSTYQQMLRYSSISGDFLDAVTDHVVKRVDPIYKLRFKNIPSEPGADWRDLPNIQLENARKLRYYYKDINGPKGNPFDAVCVCGTGQKKCNPMDEQKHCLIPWFLPHTAHKNNQWAGLYGRIHWDGFFSTTVTDPSPGGKQGRVLHPDQHRLVSVRECARSQGFPDSFQFDGTIKDRHRQIGNAVPPPLAKAVGLEIRKSLEKRLSNIR